MGGYCCCQVSLNCLDYQMQQCCFRRKTKWESPKTDVTDRMKELKFQDCWTMMGKPDPVGTCRFDTHIDYVYLGEEMEKNWRCTKLVHIDSDASDHKPVIANLECKSSDDRF